MLEEERLAVQLVDGDVFSATGVGQRGRAEARARGETGRRGAIGGAGETDHLTRVRDSFFGQICSNVSGLIFHCARMLVRIDRWTDDLTLTWPETSVEGWNLRMCAVSGRHRQRARACRRTF